MQKLLKSHRHLSLQIGEPILKWGGWRHPFWELGGDSVQVPPPVLSGLSGLARGEAALPARHASGVPWASLEAFCVRGN